MSIRQRLKASSPFTQWLLLAVALLIVGGVIGWNLYADHDFIDAGERDRLAHQARVIDENLGQQLLATSLALDSIRGDLPMVKAEKDGTARLNHRLQTLSDAMPGVRTLLVLDAEGTVTASNREELLGRNFRTREYFQIVRQSRDPVRLYVSQPYRTVLGVFAMNLVKMLVDDRGEFAGIVTATLDPEYFNILLDSVRYAPDMWASLAHGDGKLFVTVPARPGTDGADLGAPGSFFTRHRDSGQKASVMTGIVYVTGEERMMAQRVIKPANLAMDKPLVVAVTRDLPSIFAPWREHAYEQGGLWVLLVLATSLGLYFNQKRQRHFDHVAALYEAEQQRNAEQYQTIIQTSLDGFWINDSLGRIVDANESICRMLGYSPEEFLQMRVQDFAVEESPEETAAHIREATKTGRAKVESRHRRKDGKVINVEVSTHYVAALGERFFVFARDITEHRQMEEALKESELRYRTVADFTADWEYWIMPDGTFRYMSPSCEQSSGYTPDEFYADPELLTRIIHPDDLSLYIGHTHHLSAQGVPEPLDFRIHTKGGEIRWISHACRAVHDSAGQALGHRASNRDITERKQAEAELLRSNAELEQFSYAISHDMRQPLRMIASYLQLLEKGLADRLDDEKRQYLNFASDGAIRMDAMMLGLLEYSRVGRKGEPAAWVESRALLDEVRLFLQPAIAEAQAVVRIEGDWPQIFVSPDEMLRLMQNLIGNALKFRVKGRVPEVTVSGETAGKEWQMSVADNGVGIPPDQIGRLFQVFQRLQSRADYEGTGIGLALCRKIAEHHGGRIWVESAGEGQGSRFCVVLPVLREAPASGDGKRQ